MIRKSLAASALIAGLAIAGSAFAGDNINVAVKTSDLNLSTVLGQQAARERFDAAVHAACADPKNGVRVNAQIECRAKLTAKFKSRMAQAVTKAAVEQQQAGIAGAPRAIDQTPAR